MKKAGFIIAVFIFVAFSKSASAAGYQTQPYGTPCTPTYNAPCPSTSLLLDKTVQRPGKGGGEFVDNLTVNDTHFTAGQEVIFKIKIQNNGNSSLDSLTITDTLPSYLTLSQNASSDLTSGYDKSKNTVSFTISLKAGQATEKIIPTKVSATNTLSQNMLCVINYVAATGAASGSDSSQICIEKNGTTPQVLGAVPVKQSPPTGPEMLVLPMLFGTGLFGAFLKRKSK